MGPAFSRKYAVLTVTGTTAIVIPMIKRGVVDFAVGADWTPAAGDCKILIDGTAAANVANLPTAVAAGNGALWEFILTAAELTGKHIKVVIADSATKAVEDNGFLVETYGNASAMYQADLSAANLPANAVQVGGTAQTGRDLGLSVLLSTGTGTGQLDFTAGVVKANLAQILGTALTETAGFLAAGFKKFFNVSATPASTMDVLARVTLLDTLTTYTGNTVQTGDSFARIGAAGAGLTALGDARIANLDATISSRTKPADTQAAVTLVTTTTNLTTNNDKTGYALSAASVTAIWNEVVDGVFTARQLLRGFASALLGICSGMATGTGVFRDISNTKDRLTATQDANGNRSAVVRDLT